MVEIRDIRAVIWLKKDDTLVEERIIYADSRLDLENKIKDIEKELYGNFDELEVRELITR